MKAYVVEFTVRAVVMGDDESDAWSAAHVDWRDIARDEVPEVDVLNVILEERHLPTGWDLQCIPYGGDGNTRLSEIVGQE